MKRLITLGLVLLAFTTRSQDTSNKTKEPWENIYRATATKINDLVHTRLDVKFDYNKSWLYGKAWITLHPHFYATDSLRLDAKGMNINEVSVVKSGKRTPLKYTYDSLQLLIHLDKSYRASENYTVYINYVSKPNELKATGSAAITDAKGLYFINPKGEERNKPTQIWTQGETEANSAWFPTIDKPNQKTTEEISMTVPSKYVTLSNGLLVRQKKNNDGTRTDTWKMNLPHAPYLFFMGVGDYAIIKDKYKGKEVSYYVEREYAPVAKKIFGLTPEMIAFFSKVTGVDFPWPKYAQITGRDYVSGAMENTTATLHGETAQQDARQLVDGNKWESIVAHELFHQWFGDYVTAESWSNITVNESFADYSETLWNEYKYGKDAGQEQSYSDMQSYLESHSETKPLVRFHYKDKEDVFDAVSYPKGGRILNMLRNYVGDSAFFKSLNLYLTTNKFKSAEAQNLRLTFEQVTGQDLNWFWNQWYYGAGHPKLDISYNYDAAKKTSSVYIKQTQTNNFFTLPFAVDVYEGGQKKRYKVWMDQPTDTFTFPVNANPDLVNVDAENVLLAEKNDRKTFENYVYQYSYAGQYGDRIEAIAFAAKNQPATKALDFLKIALEDKSDNLRKFTLEQLSISNDTVKRFMEPAIAKLAQSDPKSTVRAVALQMLGRYKKTAYKPLFVKSLTDSSYSVAGNALDALGRIDSVAALNEAKKLFSQPAKGSLRNALIRYADESRFDSIAAIVSNTPFGSAKLAMIQPFADFITRLKDTARLAKAVDILVTSRETVPAQYHYFTDPLINTTLTGIANAKQAAGLKEQAAFIKSKVPQTKELTK